MLHRKEKDMKTMNRLYSLHIECPSSALLGSDEQSFVLMYSFLDKHKRRNCLITECS